MSRILVVDDESDVRSLVRLTLNGPGTQIIEAASGDEALTLLNDTALDVVLLDIMMPGAHDGLAVCRRIKSDPKMAKTRVILLTAKGQRADIQRGIEAGADHYLVKPFSPLALLDIMR